MTSLERMRTQRSGKPILMMLLDLGRHPSENDAKTLGKVLLALESSTRETDVTGWYRAKSIVGVLFTEVALDDRSLLLRKMFLRVSKTLRSHLNAQQFSQISVSFQFFSDSAEYAISDRADNSVVIPAPAFLPVTAGEGSSL